MRFNNIKIVLDNGEVLDYTTPDTLGIKFNRIADDFQDISKRFQDFSYTFALPKTKNNSRVWSFPDAKGRINIFNGKELDCKVYNNSDLLLSGSIELTESNDDSFKCVFNSKFAELADILKGKNLVDLTTLPVIQNWNYGKSIIPHILADYQNSDEIDYQFPLTFYKSFYTTGYTGTGTRRGPNYQLERELGVLYNNGLPYIAGLKNNPLYWQSLPPAIYLTSIVKAIINEAGFRIGGSFIEDANLKTMVVPYCGTPDDLLGALSTGTTATTFNLNRTLPDIKQLDFIKSFINIFNLYFSVNPDTKQINFENYNVFFGGDVAPIDITRKVDKNTVAKIKQSINFKVTCDTDNNNNLVSAYGRVMPYKMLGQADPYLTVSTNNYVRKQTLQTPNVLPEQYTKTAYTNLWNKVEGDKEIKTGLSPLNYAPLCIINTQNISGTTYLTGSSNACLFYDGSLQIRKQYFIASIPFISAQTPYDDKGFKAFEDTEQNFCEGNDIANWQYDGKLKLMYYYGHFKYNEGIFNNVGLPVNGYLNEWTYISITTGGTCTLPTFKRVPLPVASPFKLMSKTEKERLVSSMCTYSGENNTTKVSEVGAEAQGLLQTYFCAGTVDDTHTSNDYSLTFGDANFQYDNLYSKFYQQKVNDFKAGHLVRASINISSFDWSEMQIYKPLLYDQQIYKLVSLKNYDPVTGRAEITMMLKT